MILQPNEVFVFGSNGTGFHGAGSAGMAMRGDSRNNWRSDKEFCSHFQHNLGQPIPPDHDFRGKWAVFGVARGFQEGKEGKSYAIQTVTRPGIRRSIPLTSIFNQLLELKLFSYNHPEFTFLIARLGEGYAGYTEAEMQLVWEMLLPFPPNWKFV